MTEKLHYTTLQKKKKPLIPSSTKYIFFVSLFAQELVGPGEKQCTEHETMPPLLPFFSLLFSICLFYKDDGSFQNKKIVPQAKSK